LQRIEAADRIFVATGRDIRHGGTRAYYAEGPDYATQHPTLYLRSATFVKSTKAQKHERMKARCPSFDLAGRAVGICGNVPGPDKTSSAVTQGGQGGLRA
jgi:hypothetical protein